MEWGAASNFKLVEVMVGEGTGVEDEPEAGEEGNEEARKGAGGRGRGGTANVWRRIGRDGGWGHRASRGGEWAPEGEVGAGRNFKLVSYLPESGRHETQLEIQLPFNPPRWGQCWCLAVLQRTGDHVMGTRRKRERE